MQGWAKYHRQIINWEWYTDANTFRVFFHLVLIANHKDNKWRGIDVKRGQTITSYSKLGLALDLSVQQIRTALDKLEPNEITRKTTNKYTLINIVNYSIYQDKKSEDNTHSNTQDNNQITNEQQSNNNQITTNKNEENEDNEKNEKKNPKWADEDIELILSSHLYKHILNNNSNFKKPNLQTWAGDIDRMIRLDERNSNDIRLVIDWCQKSPFWLTNILSTSKLRKQYDQLYVKMNGAKKEKNKPINGRGGMKSVGL